MNKDIKIIKIPKELHKRLKIEAVKKELTMYDLLNEIILDHYGTTKPSKVSTKERK